MRNCLVTIFVFVFLLSLGVSAARPTFIQKDDDRRKAWNRPIKPFCIAGNIYYVGASGVSSFLITTAKGHILLDSGLEETVPLIQENISALGFKLADVKILINSHAHFDHAGGFARLKELTDARLMISVGDIPLIASGGKGDFQFGDKLSFPPATVDRILNDKDTIEMGDVTMTARITPGHTRGCTTWTMKVNEGGKSLDVVFVGSTTIPGYKLVNNLKYPEIVNDYAKSFALLKRLPCDIFLGPHGSFFSLDEKRARLAQGAQPNPFIDPTGYKSFIAETEHDYLQQLKAESR